MNLRRLLIVGASTTLLLSAAVLPALAQSPVNRPAAELFGIRPTSGIAGDGVNSASGNYARVDTDLAFPVQLLSWARTYNSLDTGTGPFGRGWTPSLSAHLVVATGSVSLHDDDGRVLTFTTNDSGGYNRALDLDADLSRASEGTFSLRYLSGEVWNFDASGRETSRSSATGGTLTFGYDDQGRLSTATHSAGQSLTIAYDPAGRVASVSANDGRTVTYGYTPDGFLSSVTGPNGLLETYDSAGGLVGRVSDAEGRALITNGYDNSGRVQHQDFGSGGSADFSYDDTARVTTMTATGDVHVAYQHDPAGHLTGVTDPAGGSITQTFDGSGHVTGVSTPGGLQVGVSYDTHGNIASRSVGGAVTKYEYDDQDRAVSITDPGGAVTRYTYTGADRVPTQIVEPTGATTKNTVADGLITESVDANGGKTSYAYDTARRLTSVTDGVGGTTRYGYDAVGRTTTVTGPRGGVTHLEYDQAGRVTSATDPGGGVTRYHYSTAGLLLDITDPTGAITRNGYDASGRRTSSTDGAGRTTTYAYGPNGQVASSTNAAGGTSRYSYDQFGRPRSVTDPAGTVITYSYDADGRQTSRTAPAGAKVTTYDSHGNVASVTDAAGRVTRYAYDANNRLSSVTDALGGVTRYTYDAAGRVLSVTDPTGAVTSYTYDGLGNRLTITDPLKHVTKFTYDAVGRVLTQTDPLGGVTSFGYDAEGHRTSLATPGGLVTRYEYDANGRLAKTVDPRGGATTYQYNARGDQISETSPGGAVRRKEFDGAGQLIRSVNPLSAATQYTYDGAGNLTSITEPSGATTKYTYDSAGQQTSSTDPLGRVTKQTYDASGNLTAVTDPAGQVLKMEYDAVGELVKRTGADGATVSYGYDALGRRVQMTDGTGTTSYAYDAASRVTSVTEPDASTYTFTYDAAGRRTSLRYPDKLTVQYAYDADDRLVGVSDPKAGKASYTLDPDGALLAEKLPGGGSRQYTYAAGLLVKYRQKTGHEVRETALVHDADSRIVKQTDNGRSTMYTYDGAGQLLTIAGRSPDLKSSNDDTLRLSYDADGNRAALTRGGKPKASYSYDAADELIAATVDGQRQTYTYDPSGRLLTHTGHEDSLAVTYDSLGTAVQTVLTRDGHSTRQRVTYNGDGLPTKFVTGPERSTGLAPNHDDTTTLRLQWTVGDRVPQVLNANGGTDFVYGYGRLFADDGRHSATFSRDVFGSALRTEGTEDWVRASGYDAFGNPQDDDGWGIGNPRFGYRGELTDASTVFLRARRYDPTTGRFTSRDPLSSLVGQTTPASPYPYADNDPLDKVDPLGKFAFGDLVGQVLALLRQNPWDHDCTTGFNPGNDLGRHLKCFQGKGPLWTRGWNFDEDCLQGINDCLSRMFKGGAEEKAAQALALHELAKQYENWWDRYWDDQLGDPTVMNQEIDWEVGDSKTDADIGFFGFRIDIVTRETNIYEVKRYEGPSTTTDVDAQLQRYQDNASHWYGINFVRGTELQEWASEFSFGGFWGIGATVVYVWGVGLPPGHVYFTDDGSRVPATTRAKADENAAENYGDEVWGNTPIIPGIPIIPEVPIIA